MTTPPDWPEGVHTVTPYFTVADADRLIEFATAAFGARLIKVNRYEDGSVQHARLQIRECILMVNQSTEAYPANISQMHFYVDDMQATFAAALENGATELMAPNLRPHGDLMAGITDPCGNVWWIAQPGPGRAE